MYEVMLNYERGVLYRFLRKFNLKGIVCVSFCKVNKSFFRNVINVFNYKVSKIKFYCKFVIIICLGRRGE